MMEILKYHILGFLIGYVLDLIIGDPHKLPHPIRLIGRWILFLEKRIYKDKRIYGLFLVMLTVIPTAAIIAVIMYFSFSASPYLFICMEAIFSFYCLATKSLIVESMAVIDSLNKDGLVAARKSLSMIVGRDTNNLTETEVLKATIETVAENTSDGVIAPMIYLCIGGPVLGMIYKACNTLDSMVGYKNDKYNNFGFFSAKIDDILNYIPSRFSAVLIVLSAFLLKGFNGKNALRIWLRDNRNHKSPNSAQSEAAFAGALSLKLAGGAYYFGKYVDKPTIGDDIKEIEKEDVNRSHRLLLATSIIGEILCMVVMFIVIR